MNVQHDLLKELVGGNYVGPVGDLLARRPSQRQIKVLDLCTGTGKWFVALFANLFILSPGLSLVVIFAGSLKWQKSFLTSNSMRSI